ncbi:signal peptidase I [Patescibacteria group bacterium]|jgi:signal peptidase I|nr:signal peptidase I [Patescibacteria group bacterium]HPD07682.1 signal peptidase I [bacterium]HRT10997.1 signal peptidase I [Patescibacteria group bacterium]HRU89848.1 signal peptidase I [Patescibacteria group bacterium]
MIFTPDFKVRWRARWLSFLEIVKIVIISAAIVIPIRLFIVCPFYVQGASMEPNFYDKEYLLVDEISYRFREPQRGDVVVFRYPEDPREYFIKRIIGLPGETLKIENGGVYVLDKSNNSWTKLSESYLSSSNETSAFETKQITVGPDEFFVLGDNREHSRDSRYFGPVNRRYLIGRVIFRGFPLKRLQFFKAPTY